MEHREPRPRAPALRQNRHRGVRLCAALLALGCGGAAPASQRPSANPRPRPASATQFEMRKPDEVGASAPGQPALGTLQPVATRPADESAAPSPVASGSDASPATPLLVAQASGPRPVALSDGKLALAGGLIIHHVPSGVVVRAVDEATTGDQLLEIVDRRGRRLALLKETSFGRAALPAGSSLLERAATTRSKAQRSDWGRGTTEIVIDTFHSETHLYTLERRARGTDWIWSGLELSTSTAEASRAE